MRAGLLTLTVSAGLGLLSVSSSVRADDWGATLKADAARIDSDITQLQADQQKLQQLIVPDKAALAAAQKLYDTDAAPLLAKLKADEQQLQDTTKTRRDAIKAARQQEDTALQAMESKLATDRQRASKDKSIAAQIPQQEAALKSAREKLNQDLKAMEEKLAADIETGKQSLKAERQSMELTLKPDTDALNKAKAQLQSDLNWQTKVAADQATLEADRQKLQQDKQAAGQ